MAKLLPCTLRREIEAIHPAAADTEETWRCMTHGGFVESSTEPIRCEGGKREDKEAGKK